MAERNVDESVKEEQTDARQAASKRLKCNWARRLVCSSRDEYGACRDRRANGEWCRSDAQYNLTDTK